MGFYVRPVSPRSPKSHGIGREMTIQAETGKDDETAHRVGTQVGYLVVEGATDSDGPVG